MSETIVDLLITNAYLVDAGGAGFGHLAVRDGRIAARYSEAEPLPEARQVIDAAGRLVLPGIVDPHVHFYGEGIGAFSRLAARGGVTTFIGMIRGAPDEPLRTVFARHREDARRQAVVDFSFHVVLYQREGILEELRPLTDQGARSFKLFLAYKRRGMMSDEAFLIAAMDRIRTLGGIALVHAEDGEVIDYLESHGAPVADAESYLASRPAQTESVSVATAALCAEATACPLYIVHLSSIEGLAAIEDARRRGVAVWVETCPQYLLFDDETFRRHGVTAKIAPPLRSARDRVGLGAALATGAINTVGSDHASHTFEAKYGAELSCAMARAPFGMPGSPTLWPAMFTWATERKVSLSTLVQAMSAMPARLFGLSARKGALLPGMDADLIVVDPEREEAVDAATFWPHVAPSPLAGASLRGWPDLTLVRGKAVWQDGKLQQQDGFGEFIPQGEVERCVRR